MDYLPSVLNLLEVQSGFSHHSTLLTKCTQVLDQRRSHEWVSLFPNEEQPTLPFPAASLCTLWRPYPAVCRTFVWTGSAWVADSLLLTNQVASAKFVSQCFHSLVPNSLSIVFNSPLYHSVFLDACGY